MKRLILVGSGHAHLFVLRQLAETPLMQVKVTLISPSPWQDYSGMYPGWMAGYYKIDQCRIDILKFVVAANIEFIQDAVVGMDAERNCIYLSDGRELHYHFLSLDVGSEIDTEQLWLSKEKLISIKPFDKFQTAWQKILQDSKAHPRYELAIVGGGAAGVELAFAAQEAFSIHAPNSRVTLIAGARGLLPDHHKSVRDRVIRNFEQQGIQLYSERAVATPSALMLGSGTQIDVDKVIAATGAKPAGWLRYSKLALDDSGYILVDASHRSISHNNVFAAGNVCSRIDIMLARSGVHAVKAGPIVTHNLIASIQGAPLKTYHPSKTSLYLLICGKHRAIASWGNWSAEGAWVWRLKDGIDRHFIARFRKIEK